MKSVAMPVFLSAIEEPARLKHRKRGDVNLFADAAVEAKAPRSPCISIGLPVFNGEKYLPIALDTLLCQTFGDFEVLLCDNASTDTTPKICEQYAANDPRIRYVRNAKNIGAAANFRLAFGLSRGTYFKWNAVDDYMAPEYLERCKMVLDSKADVVLCCSKVNMIDAEGYIVEQYPDAQELSHPSPVERFRQKFLQDRRNNTVFALIRSAVIRRTGSIGDYTGSDNVFTEELALYGKFHEVSEYLFFRRNHPNAFSYSPSLERRREFYRPDETSDRRFALVASRHFYEYARIALKAPLQPKERIHLMSFLARLAWWSKGAIAREAIAALKRPAIS